MKKVMKNQKGRKILKHSNKEKQYQKRKKEMK